jgi:hypothetical protein
MAPAFRGRRPKDFEARDAELHRPWTTIAPRKVWKGLVCFLL